MPLNTNSDEWDDFRSDARVVGRWSARWIVTIVVGVLLLGAAIWGATVLLSDVKGAGDARITKNSGGNRIAAQERFEDLYQEIKSADQRIAVAKTALDSDPDDRTLRTEHTGALQYCLSVVADYNAEARKYTAREFRAADLPPQIDPADEATDCK